MKSEYEDGQDDSGDAIFKGAMAIGATVAVIGAVVAIGGIIQDGPPPSPSDTDPMTL
jgi:hypothetical protein